MRRASAQRNTQGNKEEETGLCRGWNKDQGEETKEKQEKKITGKIRSTSFIFICMKSHQ